VPGPPGDPQTLLQNLGVPQNIVVLIEPQHSGKKFVWEAFVVNEVADDGTLRLWTRWRGYRPEENTLELASRFDLRKVHQYMRRVGLRVEEAGKVVELLAQDNSHAGLVVFKFRIVADSRFRHVFRSGPRGRGGDRLYRMTGRPRSARPGGRLRRSDRMDSLGG